MNSPTKSYEIDWARMILEQFEEEAVLVNVEFGFYYSVSATGSEILELLEQGCSAGDLALVLFGDSENLHRFQGPVNAFVERLAVEGILVARDAARPGLKTARGAPARYGAEASYEVPVLERFDDVRDLLLIDPVHQVDLEYGWPKKMNAGSLLEPKA